MRNDTVKILAIVLALAAAPACAHADTASAAALEATFKKNVSADNIGTYIKELTARPTYPGSPFSKSAADQTLKMFRDWGWDTKIETYSILFPRPKERLVELLTASKFTAKMHEPPISGDPYSVQQDEFLEPYFIYGPDGDVTAPLVYVNFGLRDDYVELARHGVSVKDKIVIVRAGRMWRGGKVQLAAEHGAIGILIYSDPKEDGFYQDLPYPEGPSRTPDGVQRGSILYGKYPGDPQTPFQPSTKNARRLPVDSKDNTIAAIPAMPLSYSDAQQLLASLDGQVAPESWRGALPITYRMGPSVADVRLKIKYDWGSTDIHNVVAKLPGTVWPKEWIVRGNHRDGWIHGAQDPHSGHSAMLEEARILGDLYKQGWRPKRTIVYASWDAEEQGVIGSTEFVEQNIKHLTDHAVVYLNTDVTGPGALQISGASSYTDFVTSLAKDIMDPNSGVSAFERARVKSLYDIYQNATKGGLGALTWNRFYDSDKNRLRLGAPGYGSDHHTFVSHAGVASLNLAFGGDQSFGAYHTAYDNYAWHSRFGDPGFRYGKATAEFNGTAVLRLAAADVLPMEFSAMADSINGEVEKLKALYAQIKNDSIHTNEMLEANAYEILADPLRPRTAPEIQHVPELDFSQLDQAATAINFAAERFAEARKKLPEATNPVDVAKINAALMQVERSFLRKDGLPGRPHYRNELYAPGRLWDTVPVPAVGDAIQDGQWDEAKRQIPLVAKTLNNIAVAINSATDTLAGEK